MKFRLSYGAGETSPWLSTGWRNGSLVKNRCAALTEDLSALLSIHWGFTDPGI